MDDKKKDFKNDKWVYIWMTVLLWVASLFTEPEIF